MKWIFGFIFFSFFFQYRGSTIDINTKLLKINGKEVTVTHQVDPQFIGRYSGSKSGFLKLNSDGTGIYKYDETSMINKNCPPQEISFEWGFIVDDQGSVVRFERPYGFSYPVIFKSMDGLKFQGCSRSFLVDYILVKKNGIITVSSSSDWVKG